MPGQWLQSAGEKMRRRNQRQSLSGQRETLSEHIRGTLGGPESKAATFKPMLGPSAGGEVQSFLQSPDIAARERMPFRPQGDGSGTPGESEKQRRMRRIALTRMQVELTKKERR